MSDNQNNQPPGQPEPIHKDSPPPPIDPPQQIEPQPATAPDSSITSPEVEFLPDDMGTLSFGEDGSSDTVELL